MKIRELATALKRLVDAEAEVEDAQRSLSFGGTLAPWQRSKNVCHGLNRIWKTCWRRTYERQVLL